MKKILLILFLLILPLNVFAVEASFSFDCNKTIVNPGDSVTCVLKANVTKETISGMSGTVSTSNAALSLSSSSVNKDVWEGDADDGEIVVYSANDKSGNFDIATFVFNASSNVFNGADITINLNDVILTDSNSNDVRVGNVTKSIRVASTVNTLSGLTLSSGALSPSFNTNVLNYTATLDASSVTINATPTNSSSRVSGTGNFNLNYGINVLKVNVTSESNNIKTYTISITRPDNRDSDNTISSLKLNGEDILISNNSDRISYQVENEVSELDIESVLASNKASFVDGFGPRKVTLKEGDNVIEIKVRAENESVKIYTININRKSKLNDNNEENDKDNNNNKDNDIKDNNDEDKLEGGSPVTGNVSKVVIFLFVVAISLALIVISYKQIKKKEVKNNG